jgi:lipopolysaccharide/colanic/teichoic acid biosynthesis glycosyltransferase
MYKKSGKRIIDIWIAGTGIILLFPLFILLTIFLTGYFRGNPFFFQTRIGLNEKAFTIFKFRTLREHNTEMSMAANVPLTGRVLRASSIDELPQLFNVLIGDMSLVGPRPLLTEYLPLYNAEQRLRHSVLPGITGLAQTRGGNHLSWIERFDFDIQYVKQQSWQLDFQILCETAKRFFSRKRVPETQPCEKFKGNTL